MFTFYDVGIKSFVVCKRCDHRFSVYILFQEICIGSFSVCKRDVHRFLYILCFRILVLGHTQCVREMFTDYCIYCVLGYCYWVILSVYERCSQISVNIVFQDIGIGSYSVCKRNVHRFL